MARYRKKPVEIEAEIYKKGMEDGFVDVMESIGEGIRGVRKVGKPFIQTLEGRMIVTEGDYIITGVKGERYPCKPDIFEMTYEKV